MGLIRFLGSGPGRVVRGAAGLGIVGAGTRLALRRGGRWWLLAALGVVPVLAGALDLCFLGPLVHEPVARRSRAA